MCKRAPPRRRARASAPLRDPTDDRHFGEVQVRIPQHRGQPMTTHETFRIRRLAGDDIATLRAMMAMMGEAFEDRATYTAAQPDDAYLRTLLDGRQFIAIAAIADGAVVGGLAAYELPKFEQARSELYIYDLAVDTSHRRRGIATALIAELREV